MTTNHHTPITTGADAASSVVNSPLGEIDEVLSDMLSGAQEFSGLLVGTGSLDASAIMELISTSKGVLLPRMSGSQIAAISTPATGLLVYNMTTSQFEYYNGSAWLAVGAYVGAGCRAYHQSGVSISDVTETVLALDAERYDTDGYHSTVTNNSRLTVPSGKGGKYVITASAAWASSSDTGWFKIEILLNGTDIIAVHTQYQDSVTARSNVSTVYELVVTDYIEMRVYQNTGGSIVLSASQYYSPELAMQFLGS